MAIGGPLRAWKLQQTGVPDCPRLRQQSFAVCNSTLTFCRWCRCDRRARQACKKAWGSPLPPCHQRTTFAPTRAA